MFQLLWREIGKKIQTRVTISLYFSVHIVYDSVYPDPFVGVCQRLMDFVPAGGQNADLCHVSVKERDAMNEY